MHEGQRISYVNVWPITKCNRNKEGPIINVHSQLHLLTGYARERLCGNFGIRFFDRKKCVLQGISDSHTRPRGLPFNGLYILLYRVKYKAGKSLFCVRLEAEIQLESGLDLNRESTALAVLHICSDQQKYNKTTFYFKNITFIHNYDRGVHLPFMPYSGYCCTTIIFTSLNAGNKIIILAMTEWAKIIYCRLSVFFVCCFLGGGVGLYFCFHCSVHFCIYIVQLFKSMHCSICLFNTLLYFKGNLWAIGHSEWNMSKYVVIKNITTEQKYCIT